MKLIRILSDATADCAWLLSDFGVAQRQNDIGMKSSSNLLTTIIIKRSLISHRILIDLGINLVSEMSGSVDSAHSAHRLDFCQAMTEFKLMFPDMDERVIEAVLRANGGAVDATVDQLLTMNIDSDQPAAAVATSDAPRPQSSATVNRLLELIGRSRVCMHNLFL